MSSKRDRAIMSLYSVTSGYHNPTSGIRAYEYPTSGKKENCWTFFAAAAQVYEGRIHESVESVEMISSYEIRVSLEFSRGARICYCVEELRVTHKIRWWQAASIRKKGFRSVLDLQSQGVCDYMHWSLGFLHVLQVIGTESMVEHKGFSHWFFYGIV
ncbi:hypothetical protein YC2023_085348 [Brassica napus]